ncbi:MAG: FeS assembly protein SufD [Microgenomates group bacterium GW2011_GWB1_40_9]|nr:MAG: FeS assembly protein SufD [Microgenomates group bacterium GW2011_GWC1_39_12]KKR79900.1 MAG: FeS assembly protein SufD [Microgenomates group bacterium GW2011_GWB1_40_9]
MKRKIYRIAEGKNKKIKFIVDHSFDLEVIFQGKNSSAEIVGLVMPKPHTNIIIRTKQIHNYPQSKSNLLIRSVISEGSCVTYEGTIRIEKHARYVDAYQKNETMLLSDTSQIHTSPILEILNHDVKCTHGATVKPISETELLYLQSRGISRLQARKMIVRGFIDGIIKNNLYD